MALTERQKINAERNRIYWATREEEALKHYIKDEKEYDKQLKRIYSNMLDSVQNEINAFYGRYADKEGITLAEAKKRVSKLDIEAYERKAKRYVKDKDFSAKANEEMRLYNLTMKVNRLEMLKANIGLELITGHDELEKFMSGILKGRTEEELARQAGILGKTVRNNAQKAHAIINSSFHNATFSDRIWQYQDLMRIELDRLLQTGLIQGKNARAITGELKKYWYGNDPKTGGGAVYCMERLMRTELARVQTEAQKQSFVRNGFEQYTFIVNGGCCPICEALSGKHFKVSKMMPGENAPPMHPHCRCSTAAYEDSAEYEAWLDFLEKGGTPESWDSIKHSIEKGAFASEQPLTFGTNDVDLAYIKSSEYRRKYTQLTQNTAVNNKIRDFLSGVLTQNNGTNTESLLIIDADSGYEIIKKIGKKDQLGVELTDAEIEKVRAYPGRKIGVHNHPTNIYPTGSDFVAAGYRRYDFGIVAAHDGRVFKYATGNTPVSAKLIDGCIDKNTRDHYNESEKRKGFKKALDELGREYGLKWEEL